MSQWICNIIFTNVFTGDNKEFLYLIFKVWWEGGAEWLRHQMDTFSALLVICAGNSAVTGEFSAQRPVTRSFDVILICACINGWVNNRKAGDLRCYRAHYDVIVMELYCSSGPVIKPNQLDPQSTDRVKLTLLSCPMSYQMLSYGWNYPSRMSQNFVSVAARCRRESFPIWSLFHRLSWSGLINVWGN